jgi:hypothetical protein
LQVGQTLELEDTAERQTVGLDRHDREPVWVARASTVPRESQDGLDVLLETTEVSAAQCTDDVRFNFISTSIDHPPRYVAEYQNGPFIDVNEPARVEPEGNAFLVIRFEKSQASYLGRQTYRSRESITPSGMHQLKEVRLVSSPENTILFVIGLDEQRPFLVDGATSPPHVVVRIA